MIKLKDYTDASIECPPRLDVFCGIPSEGGGALGGLVFDSSGHVNSGHPSYDITGWDPIYDPSYDGSRATGGAVGAKVFMASFATYLVLMFTYLRN